MEERRIPSTADIWDQSWEVNWAPLSLVIWSGTPKRDTQLYNNAAHRDGVEVSERGMASGHLLNRSTIVNRWVQPREKGNGPTRSICT